MRRGLLALPIFALAAWWGFTRDHTATVPAIARTPPLTVETLVSGLDTPWDLAWGPDGAIWVTERRGIISRVDPSTGNLQQVGTVDVVEVSESGLMGMAFHPVFSSEPYVFLAYSYGRRSSIRNRLVRMRFDGTRLHNERILLDNIPGNTNHDGARLTVGPDNFLYMTTGDAARGELSQDLNSLAGKVLRLTLDGRPVPGNPFSSLVFSYGHRNPQGIVFHPTSGQLYAAEHGPGDNDEVNELHLGGNYGWPAVHGFCDGDRSGEQTYCGQHRVIEPLAAWTPTLGVSGMDFYDSETITGWRGSLLVTSLRGTSLVRLQLSADGSSVVAEESLFRGEFGRLRDVLVGPDGEVYLATSNRDGRGRPRSGDDRILRVTQAR